MYIHVAVILTVCVLLQPIEDPICAVCATEKSMIVVRKATSSTYI